jgi:SAM-dependent methyltransferase
VPKRLLGAQPGELTPALVDVEAASFGAGDKDPDGRVRDEGLEQVLAELERGSRGVRKARLDDGQGRRALDPQVDAVPIGTNALSGIPERGSLRTPFGCCQELGAEDVDRAPFAARMKLDLACGTGCTPGFEGVDIAPLPGVMHVVNLLDFPWHLADESAEEIVCNHFIEHLPALFWTPAVSVSPNGVESIISFGDEGHVSSMARRLTAYQVNKYSVELLLKFFDECYRILKPGGVMRVSCPQAHSDRAFQDPTHRRFIVPATFLYLNREWRRSGGLEHGAYGISCDFQLGPGSMQHSMTPFLQEQLQRALKKVPPQQRTEAAQERTETLWNAVHDLEVILTKPGVPSDLAQPQRAQEGGVK